MNKMTKEELLARKTELIKELASIDAHISGITEWDDFEEWSKFAEKTKYRYLSRVPKELRDLIGDDWDRYKTITYDYLLDWYEDEEKDLEKLEELLMKYNFGSVTIDW